MYTKFKMVNISFQKFLQDHHKRVDRDYQEAIKEDTLEQLREIVDKYIHKANSL